MKLDWNWTKKVPAFLKRYRYPALILLLGIGLMLWPGRGWKTEQTVQPVQTQAADAPESESAYLRRMEAELTKILSEMEGAGQVRVMLTLRTSASTQYQMNEESQSQTDGTKNSVNKRTETVMTSRGSSYNEPTVVRQFYPAFQGALIVSQGGEDPAVRYRIANAVSALLGIGTDQITVVKMK